MNLHSLSDSQLLEETKRLIGEERLMTAQILRSLREIEVRRLYLERGYPSLFAFCTAFLGYEESQAQRRISAMRLLKEVPDIESKITSGDLTLTALTQAQSFFHQMAKSAKPLDISEKCAVLKTLEGKSTRQCETELLKINPNPIPKKIESQRAITPELTEVKIILDRKTLEKLQRIRELLSHKPMNTAQLIDKLADEMLSKIAPGRKRMRKNKVSGEIVKSQGPWERQEMLESLGAQESQELEESQKTQEVDEPRESPESNIANESQGAPGDRRRHFASQPAAPKVTRYIPADVKRAVWKRDQGRCCYVDPITKRECASKWKLQLDHIKPFALGGTASEDNLRLYCQAHNLFGAVQIFGKRRKGEFAQG